MSKQLLHSRTAIGALIREADQVEIEALERRRNRVRQVKQGMMQQLLTRKVRLIRLDPVVRK